MGTGIGIHTARWEGTQVAEGQAGAEQILGQPARPLEAPLPTSLNMPKFGFWSEMEAQRPMCPQGENIFVHSILTRASWQCLGDHARESSVPSPLLLKDSD